jgi:predicted nucleotidyltransferase
MLQLKSSDSVQTISLNRTEAMAALSGIAARIRETHSEVLSVRLFGSVARGDQAGISDLDVLIILKGGEPGDPLHWIRRFYAWFRLPVAVDLLVYSEIQVAERLQSGDPWMARIWKESIVLAE